MRFQSSMLQMQLLRSWHLLASTSGTPQRLTGNTKKQHQTKNLERFSLITNLLRLTKVMKSRQLKKKKNLVFLSNTFSALASTVRWFLDNYDEVRK